MAEAVVSFAVERIGNLLIEEAKFLHGVRDQVLELQTELLRMQCFLEDADAIRYKDKRVSNWVSEIREFAYSAENVLNTFIYEVESRRRIRGIRRFQCLLNKGMALHKVGSEMETLKIKITNLTARLQTYGIRNLPSVRHEASEKHLLLRRTYSHVVEEDFVGFEDVISDMVAKLVDKERKFRTVSICGMGGLGKTTLAKKIYHHVRVRRHFEAFAWACISQQWKKEDVLQGILMNLAPEKMEEIARMENKDQQLVKQLFQVQKKKKCLVVLDDVWSTDVWDIIGPAFPSESKILITSRNKDVAAYIDPIGFLHQPDLLDEQESLELFQKKALLRGEHSDSTIKEKVKLGKEMVKHCRGLPLAIVVLGGLLARKYTLNEWQTVHQHIDSYLGRDKSCREHGVGISEVLALSYHDLPYWLKPCFLYLGNFPEDYVIEAKTLYQLWMAEGFISLEEEAIRRNEETAMEVAERYLSELAQRCMVQVQIKDDYHTRSGRRFKSCGLHDLMRDMCLSMVKEENFSKIIDYRQSNDQQICLSSSSFGTSSIHNCKIHRLAIHWINDINLYLPSYQEKDIRSVLFFHGEKCTYKFCQKMLSRIMKDFKLVRVLDLQGFYRYGISLSLPKTMGNLVHLRYLSLKNANFFKLPSSIGNLRYLDTLDLRSAVEPIVPNVLWKLERLRHLYLNQRSLLVRNGKLRLDGLSNLETLHNFNSRYCNVEHLQKLNNLRSLTNARIDSNLKDLEVFIRYLTSITQKPLVLLRHSTARVGGIFFGRGNFCDAIDFCTKEGQILVRKMFFECHELHKLQLCGRICELPEYQQGSNSSLTHLSLVRCKLEEDPLPRLGKLPNLITLQLQIDSFLGKKMVCSTQSFPLLKSLQLSGLSNLEDWRVDEGALPSLSFLQIKRCTKLKMVPDGLRCITTLQELSIDWRSRTLVNRLRLPDGTEGEDFDKVRHIPYIKFGDSDWMDWL